MSNIVFLFGVYLICLALGMDSLSIENQTSLGIVTGIAIIADVSKYIKGLIEV